MLSRKRISNIVVMMGYYAAEIPDGPTLFRGSGEPIQRQHGDWKRVIWGEPFSRLGRLPQAIWFAETIKADWLIFAMGDARFGDGTSEAEFMFDYARSHRGELLNDFGSRFQPDSVIRSANAYEQWVQSKILLESAGYNTATAMRGLAGMINNPRFTRRNDCIVHFVSSANHISRVVANALAGFEDYDFGDRRVTVAGVAAETYYSENGIKDIKVQDRGDAPNKHWIKP